MLKRIRAAIKHTENHRDPYLVKQAYFAISITILALCAHAIDNEFDFIIGPTVYMLALLITRFSKEQNMARFFKAVMTLAILFGTIIFIATIACLMSTSANPTIPNALPKALGSAIGNSITACAFWRLEHHWKQKETV